MAFIINVTAFAFFSSHALADKSEKVLSKEGEALLSKGIGANNEAYFFQIASTLTKRDFIAALYGKNRQLRIVALDCAAYFENPWPLVPYLASFMSVPERQVSSTAAQSLTLILKNTYDLRHSRSFPVKGQVKQLISQLHSVIVDSNVEMDIRVSAIKNIGVLIENESVKYNGLSNLLKNESELIRLSAMGLISLPMSDDTLRAVVKLATEDSSVIIKGLAVSLICENALSHNISKPSEDLKELVSHFFNSYIDTIAAAPVLGCLARFPYRHRAALTDKILKSKNEKIITYWKKLTKP